MFHEGALATEHQEDDVKRLRRRCGRAASPVEICLPPITRQQDIHVRYSMALVFVVKLKVTRNHMVYRCPHPSMVLPVPAWLRRGSPCTLPAAIAAAALWRQMHVCMLGSACSDQIHWNCWGHGTASPLPSWCVEGRRLGTGRLCCCRVQCHAFCACRVGRSPGGTPRSRLYWKP